MGTGNRFIEIEERGYGESDKIVCSKCFNDDCLKQYILDNGAENTCDYGHGEQICLDLEELMAVVMPGIRHDYVEIENSGIPWDQEEGRYWAETYHSHELIQDLYDELGTDNNQLLDDIADIMGDTDWCKGGLYEESHFDIWQRFCHLVKHETRFVFDRADSRSEHDPWYTNPSTILDTIQKYVRDNDYVHLWKPERRKIYRGRTHGKNETLCDVKEFGPPPVEKTKPNRMSAEGISMFYAALDSQTALKEIYTETDEYATVAEFSFLRPLRIVDFPTANILDLPSLFSEKTRDRRTAQLFLRNFSNDMSKPANSDNHTDYVPTQIVTEYFRHIFKDKKGNSIDGISYYSAQYESDNRLYKTKPRGKCVVLFINPNECVDDNTHFSKDAVLLMDTASIKRYKKEFVEEK